jgi:thioesterase domain-containing protein
LGRVYGEKFSVRTVFEKPTIEQMAMFVRQEIAFTPPTSVIPINPHGKRYPFFCVHPSGGLANCYIGLAHHLGPEQPLYGFQSRGMDERQLPLTSIEDMAALYVEDMRRIQPSGPYIIGGWSFGGTVAYEMAQQLIAAEEEVLMLILLDTVPNLDPVDLPLSEEELMKHEQESLARDLERYLGITCDQIVGLTFDQQLQLFFERSKLSHRIPSDITLDQYRRFVRVTATNERVARRYRPKPYPDNVTLLRSSLVQSESEGYGWENLTAAIKICQFPTAHSSFVYEPNAQALATELASCIATAVQKRTFGPQRTTSEFQRGKMYGQQQVLS